MTPSERINAKQTIETFLKDDVIAGVLAKMERKYYEEFKQAMTSEERVRAWSKANLLDDFVHGMAAVVESGKAALLEMAAEQKNAERRKRGHPLPGE